MTFRKRIKAKFKLSLRKFGMLCKKPTTPSKPSFEDRSLKFIGRHNKAFWLVIAVVAAVVVVFTEA